MKLARRGCLICDLAILRPGYLATQALFAFWSGLAVPQAHGFLASIPAAIL